MSWLDQVRTDKPARPAATPVTVDPFDPARTGSGQGYARAALDGEVERLLSAQNGTRNHTLNRAAFSLSQLVSGGELDQQLVITELTAAARLIGLNESEILPTILSGFSAGAAHPRTVPVVPSPPWTVPGQDGTGDGQEDTKGDWVRANLPRTDWHALWAAEDDEEWIIEPILPARRLVALYSPPKVGKSLLMLELAVSVARGEDVLGVTPDRPRRVLYVDFENDPRGDVKERLTAMGYGPDDLSALDYLSFPVLAALDSDQGGLQLMAAVEVYGSEVVIIDTVSRAIKGEENENDTWLAFYRHTGKRLKAAGVALIRLDHTGKDEKKGQRGGSAKSGDVDAVWRLSRVTDTTFRLECEANRMPVTEKTLVIHRETTPRLRHRVDGGGRSAAWRAQREAVLAALDAAGLDRNAGRDQARKVLKAVNIQVSNGGLAEILRRRKESMSVEFRPVLDLADRSTPDDLSPTSEDRSGQVANDAE